MIILQIHNRYLTRGGEDESREAEVRLLRGHGHRVIEYVEDNQRVLALGRIRTALRTIWSQESFRRVEALIRSEHPDVVVVHNFFPLVSPSVYYAARRHGVPVVQYIRNYRLFCPSALFFREGRICERCLGKWLAVPGIRYRCYHHSLSASAVVALMSAFHRLLGTWRSRVDRYITLSEFAWRKCAEGGLKAAHLAVHPNFVHPDPGQGDGAGNFILFAGRIAPEKGLATVLKAWRTWRHPVPLKIIGDGPEAAGMRAQTAGWAGVEWLGRKSSAETLEMMGQAAALVVPSECYETFGRVAIEAYARGTPVIASRLGALEELVEEGRTGFLFKPGDAGDLAARLDEFLAMNPAAQAAMRQAARMQYERHYSAEHHYAKLMELLSSVAGSRSPESPARFDVLGVRISALTLDGAVQLIGKWIAEGGRHYVNVCTSGTVLECHDQPRLAQIVNGAGMATPDGMPLVWIGRWRGFQVARVYGPDLMLAVSEQGRARGVRHFYYGSTGPVLERLCDRLQQRFPGLEVVGRYAPPFRPLTEDEVRETAALINASRPDVVWVGLGTPKQDEWVGRFRPLLEAPVLVAVGAAFDFHAGTLRQAPRWMMRLGLEWFFRLLMEPRRLWRRYLIGNSRFVILVLQQWWRERFGGKG